MAMTPELETRVVQLLFEQAEAAHWTYLTDRQKTAMYNGWVQHDEIGGRLRGFMSPQEARVWIKDGPMKEYARAMFGVGKYASLIKNPHAGPAQLVVQALGPGWQIDLDKGQTKPLRVRVHKDDEQLTFAWAPAYALKHLVWAAISAQAEGDAIDWVLCLVGSFERPIPTEEKAANLRIGARAGLRVVHV